MTTLQLLTRTDGIFENVRRIRNDMEGISQTLARAGDELRKAQADLYLWKQCADHLAKHVWKNEDGCKALENYERLKATT